MGLRDRIVLTGLGLGYTASLRGAWVRFRRGAERPALAQSRRLMGLLADNGATAFGREHRFDRLGTIAAYQDGVPIRRYRDFEPWIERIANGEEKVLTEASVRMMERSSGSTRGPKLIPYTQGLLDEFASLTGPWLYDLMTRRRALLGTRSYWSVSPAARHPEHTPGGLRIGFEDDTEYFGPAARWALETMMAVPGTVARIPDMEQWRFETARLLIEAEDLGFVSVWNASFFSLILETMKRRADGLLGVLTPSSAARFGRALQADERFASRLWPRLSLLSCWTDGHAALSADALARELPGVEIQGKGLLATEGAISFPISGAEGGAVVSPTGHFLEFIDVAHPAARPKLVHELQIGGRYSPVLSTAGGLYRYHLEDELEVVGRYASLPVARFLGRLDKVGDLCGEKVSAGEAARAIDAAKTKTGAEPSFVLLAPTQRGAARYRLYVETSPSRAAALAEEVERQLLGGHHYRYCRELGQLAAVEAVTVQGGHEIFERALVAEGMRAGSIKPDVFDARLIWHDAFEGVASR